jgi:hypothetical protein
LFFWLLGFPDQAIANARRGVEEADAAQHFDSIVIAHCMHAWVLLMRREFADAEQSAEEAIAISKRQGSRSTARGARSWSTPARDSFHRRYWPAARKHVCEPVTQTP